LVYTSTVATTQALTSSLLDVAAPDALGGQQPPALLAFGPATQTLTQAMVLTAQPGALDQADAITSTVRAFLPDAGPADWNASLEPQSRLGGFTRNAQFTRAAASHPDRPDSYLLSTLTSNAAPSDPIQGSQGDIWLHDARGGGATTVDMDQNDRAILRGGHAPTVTCTDGGCLTVWDQIENCSTISFDSLTDNFSKNGQFANLAVYLFNDPSQQNTSQATLVWAGGNLANGSTYAFPRSLRFCDSTRIEVWYWGSGTVESPVPSDSLGTLTIRPADVGVATHRFVNSDPNHWATLSYSIAA